jgi:hypothetical protein
MFRKRQSLRASPAGMIEIVRGQGAACRKLALCDVVAARRLASVAVSVAQIPREGEDQAVAHGGDVSGSRVAGQEGDLTYRLAGPDLGYRLAAPVEGDHETARYHHIERVCRVPLAHQQVTAAKRAQYAALGKCHPLRLGQAREKIDFRDAVEKTVGGFHETRTACCRALTIGRAVSIRTGLIDEAG